MARLLVCLAAFTLVGASAALAGRGDPEMKLTAADNARARSMVLRRADVGPGFNSAPGSRPDTDFYCRAVDQSDLTATGQAVSPSYYNAGFIVIASYAYIYESVADANTAWRQLTSAAGQQCMREGIRRAYRSVGARVISFERVVAPRVAQRSIAFRLVFDRVGGRVFADIVVLKQSRAFASLSFGSGGAPMPKATVDRLARTVAARMKTAMRS